MEKRNTYNMIGFKVDDVEIVRHCPYLLKCIRNNLLTHDIGTFEIQRARVCLLVTYSETLVLGLYQQIL